MPLALPPYDPDDPEGTQFILDLIAKAMIDTGGRAIKVRFGTDTVVYTAANSSAAKTISHGLGTAPIAVFCQMTSPVVNSIFYIDSVSATTFVTRGHETTNAAVTGSQPFYWVAFG